MTSVPVLFISVGFPDERDARYPALDKVGMSHLLHTLSDYAARGDCRLMIRHHPAIAPMMEILLEEKPGNLIVVPESADMAAILQTAKPASVIFMGGDLQSLEDFSHMVNDRSTILLPLPGTGGAAQLIEAEQKARGITPFVVRGIGREDPYGFDRVHCLMPCLMPKPVPVPKLRGPQPG
jgi:hypothetical protein